MMFIVVQTFYNVHILHLKYKPTARTSVINCKNRLLKKGPWTAASVTESVVLLEGIDVVEVTEVDEVLEGVLVDVVTVVSSVLLIN